ncbi:glycerol dehydratase reactivase beta/small subunit family protein [Vibrio alginolyticus]|uniref:glycerol dehydratase reactivase beta/small subunit family protein n=1 Tax=Vibrio alginolyticus TaxID=663 RepID=UPI001BD561FD|nr:glycerol dehydratase reactivase beta/small subunit family protein [Vibrio alginolyticus]MBT0092244.1 hypothetical protein [Vibrio alginolyticus]
MSLSSPGVHLFYHSLWQDTRVLDELCWGLEEQGVPCRTICCDEHDCALALSKLAAKEGANKRGNCSRLTQSFHFFMFEPFFLP